MISTFFSAVYSDSTSHVDPALAVVEAAPPAAGPDFSWISQGMSCKIHGKRMGCIIINHVMFSSKMFQLTFPLINAHGTSRDYMQTCVKIEAPYNGWSGQYTK